MKTSMIYRISVSAPWIDLFSVQTEDAYVGFVSSGKDFQDVKWAYEVETGSSFVCTKTSQSLGNTGRPCKFNFKIYLMKDPYLINHLNLWCCIQYIFPISIP